MINHNRKTILLKLLYLILALFILSACKQKPAGEIFVSDNFPKMDPDYNGVTIPPNIAPLNFIIKEEGSAFYVKIIADQGDVLEIYSGSNDILIPGTKWKQILENNKGNNLKLEVSSMDDSGIWTSYKAFTYSIAEEAIDPYLYYRLLFPGYESWSELSINLRNTESFKDQPLIENPVVDENCVNCHSFNTSNNNNFLFHMRGGLGGAYFYEGGDFKKVNLKTSEMKNGAVYPRWHPSGKFVAFSSNKIIQQFHAADNKKVEVSDLESSLVLYDIDKNEMMDIVLSDRERYMDTYPEWSPDGQYLYFCRADTIGENYDFHDIKYNLYRVPFIEQNRSVGEAELVFDAKASGHSVAFPRISPDGKFLILTYFDYGCFPIWHKEADLYLIELESFKADKLDLNSDFTDSYHSWSSNSKWLVFSSKRRDGLTARPYISYINEDGSSEKPFILPQKDPDFYNGYLKTFNRPEFSTVKIDLSPGNIRRLSKTDAIQAIWYKK